MLPAPKVHCSQLFCIELYSVELFGSVVLEKRGSEHVFGCDAGWRKFLCKRTLRWLRIDYHLPLEATTLFEFQRNLTRKEATISKKQSNLYVFFSKLPLVCILALVTEQEVCPRLLRLQCTKTPNTKYSLRWVRPYVHKSKYAIAYSQQKSSKSQPKAPQPYQHRDLLSLGYDTAVWTAGVLKFPCVGQLGPQKCCNGQENVKSWKKG